MPDRKRLAWQLRWRTAPRMASALRIRTARLTHGHARVVIPDSVLAGPGFRLEIPGDATFIVGEHVHFRNGFYAEIAPGGLLTIGAGSIFTGETMIQCTTTISIGERCIFGQSTFIADGSHRFRDHTQHLLDQGYSFRPITIADNAIVHTKSTVVADLGFRSVVGANSFVNRNVPAYTLVGGVPAKVLEYFGPAEGAAEPP